MPRNPVQGQDLDCPTILQRLEARLMGMSVATLYGKVAELKKTSASAPVTGRFTGASEGPQTQDNEMGTLVLQPVRSVLQSSSGYL